LRSIGRVGSVDFVGRSEGKEDQLPCRFKKGKGGPRPSNKAVVAERKRGKEKKKGA